MFVASAGMRTVRRAALVSVASMVTDIGWQAVDADAAGTATAEAITGIDQAAPFTIVRRPIICSFEGEEARFTMVR